MVARLARRLFGVITRVVYRQGDTHFGAHRPAGATQSISQTRRGLPCCRSIGRQTFASRQQAIDQSKQY